MVLVDGLIERVDLLLHVRASEECVPELFA